VAALVAALEDLLVLVEDAIEGSDGAEIGALVDQGGPDLDWWLIDEAGFVQNPQHFLLLNEAQGAGRFGPRSWLHRRSKQTGAPTLHAGA
jgi:hypothetical protein